MLDEMINADDKLSLHLPDVANDFPYGHEITLHQIATHTWGNKYVKKLLNEILLILSSYDELIACAIIEQDLHYSNISAVDIINHTQMKQSWSKPGEIWSYNNAGYIILGLLLEKLHKKPLVQIIHDNITAPLGMNNTRLESGISNIEVHGYFWFPSLYRGTLIPRKSLFELLSQ